MVKFKMRVSTRGRVTIPKRLRELMGIGPRAEIGFVPRGEEVKLVIKSPGDVQGHRGKRGDLQKRST
jgi:AbrB family looped-hinge helix DNA binding protein